MKKIFVSYTTMSKEINEKSLQDIKALLEVYSEPYIELLDKNSSKSQESIINNLKESDMVLLVKTKEVTESKWVQLELSCAAEFNIPIIEYTIDELENLDFKSISNIQ